jgi:hypothetical protein
MREEVYAAKQEQQLEQEVVDLEHVRCKLEECGVQLLCSIEFLEDY